MAINYVKVPPFMSLTGLYPLYRTIEGEQENAETVHSESASNMVSTRSLTNVVA